MLVMAALDANLLVVEIVVEIVVSFFFMLRPRAASTRPASDALHFSGMAEPAEPIAKPRRSNTK